MSKDHRRDLYCPGPIDREHVIESIVDHHYTLFNWSARRGELSKLLGALALFVVALGKARVREAHHGLLLVNAVNVVFGTGGPAVIYQASVYPEVHTGAIGLALMVILSLFPGGVLQLADAIKNGYWHARSAEFMGGKTMKTFEWIIFSNPLKARGLHPLGAPSVHPTDS